MFEEKEVVEKKKFGIGIITVITVLLLVAVFVGIVFTMRIMGKQKLTAHTAAAETVKVGKAKDGLAEGQVLYNGKVYQRNEDMITILLMGIDKETYTEVGGASWSEEEGSKLAGGQADALFLLLLNPHNKQINLIAINRNSMADIDVFDAEGNYTGVFKKQIALQHGYGDGGEESCNRQVQAVSRMFHNIPIDSYAAVSMDAIPELNDAVGGVTVEVLDDIVYPEYDMDLHQGDTVTLHGEKAYWYIRLRNETAFNSNELRLQRQKQYMTAFAAAAKRQVSSDIRVAVQLFQLAQKYMVTDIDLSGFTYLATEALDYQFDVNNLYTLKGETMQGNQFEEFYVDDDALQDLIIRLFYEQVKE